MATTNVLSNVDILLSGCHCHKSSCLAKMGLPVEEGSSNENPSPVVNPNITVEEEEEQSDLFTRLTAASRVLSANPKDAIKELEKDQEKADLRAMLVEIGLDPANFEKEIANAVEQENWNLDFRDFGMFRRITRMFS